MQLLGAVFSTLYPSPLTSRFIHCKFITSKTSSSVGLDPSRLYAKQNIVPGGVFSIVQNFDENYIIVPLEFAARASRLW